MVERNRISAMGQTASNCLLRPIRMICMLFYTGGEMKKVFNWHRSVDCFYTEGKTGMRYLIGSPSLMLFT